MDKLRILLLPGLDGTGKLFKRFIAAAPSDVTVKPVPLPVDTPEYGRLVERLISIVPSDDATILLAESYSGPLAVRLAERQRVRGLIFCNSFLSAPRPRLPGWLARPELFRLALHPFLLRRYLVGPDADEELVREVAAGIASVPADVLAGRFRLLLDVDEAESFARCSCPVLYLRGTHDRLVSEASWRRMGAIRPMMVAEVKGPHLLLQANPDGAWKAIVSFLKSQQGDRIFLPRPTPS